jgi:hypothetical protein
MQRLADPQKGTTSARGSPRREQPYPGYTPRGLLELESELSVRSMKAEICVLIIGGNHAPRFLRVPNSLSPCLLS